MRLRALLPGIRTAAPALYAPGASAVSGIVPDEPRRPIRRALVVIDPDALSRGARTDAVGRLAITARGAAYRAELDAKSRQHLRGRGDLDAGAIVQESRLQVQGAECRMHPDRASAVRRAALLLLLACLTSANAMAQGVSVVSGVVRDEAGAPVREALVAIDPDSLSLRARTSADGRYRIFAVPRGRYEVRVVRIGHRPISQMLDVNAEQITFDVQMETVPIPLDNVTVRVSRPGLHGRILSHGIELLRHEPTPVRSANIQVLNEPYRVKSDADGRFSIPELAIGSHSILVALDHYVTRLVAVTVPPEGGVEITVTLDSLYADYQRKDEVQKREIGWRLRQANHPATFVSAHELDPGAKDLREALRFAPSVLTRGINLMDTRLRPVIYIDGQLTNLHFTDLKSEDIAQFAGIEVYPSNTLTDALSVPGSSANIGFLNDGVLFGGGQRAPGSFSSRTTARSRGNTTMLIMIWTTRRR